MDKLQLYDLPLNNRLLLGTALYPNIDVMLESIAAARAEMVTVSLKRELNSTKNNYFWQCLKKTSCSILPNTAGCRTAEEAIFIAEAARSIFKTNFIKLEIIGDAHTLQPDVMELIKATQILIKKDFKVLPYCTDDLIVCQKLVQLGCSVIMPLASYIGSGRGIMNKSSFSLLRSRLKDIVLIVDAGIGVPSDAASAMELGFDGVLLNSAVALSRNPKLMAQAFHNGVIAGRMSYLATRMPIRDLGCASTPLQDTPFWHQHESNEKNHNG